jgi:hypothetical protein
MTAATLDCLGEECDHGTSLNAAGVGLFGRNMSNASRSTVTLHVVSSLDGFIAKKDNSVSWMDSSGDVYERGVTDDGAEEVIKSIDCYVLGSRTYEHALQLGWPYGDTPHGCDNKQKTAVHEGERGVLLRRSQEIGG